MRNALLYGCLNDLKNRLIQLENWGGNLVARSRQFGPSSLRAWEALPVISTVGEIIHSVCEATENCAGEGILLLLNEL